VLGTCFDGSCGFTPLEVAVSIAVPVAFFALPVALECGLFRRRPLAALRDLGLTRPRAGGVVLAGLFALPLAAYFPALAVATGSPLALQPHWPWLLLGVALNNGLAEETMMRGFVFRHLREGRTFWRAAALSTAYFAAYHVPLVFTQGPAIGTAAIVLAVPTGFVTALLYERGGNTVWAPVLMHVANNGLVMLVVPPVPWAPLGYMALSTLTGVALLTASKRAPEPATT